MQLYYRNNLYNFFDEAIKIPCCEEKTKAYIIGIFSSIKTTEDLSKESITLLYNEALEKYSFNTFRQIGDWLFFAKTLFPNSLNGASPEYYTTIASDSYYRCYTIMNKKWLIFEELADRFDPLTYSVRKSLCSSKRTGGLDRLTQFKLNKPIFI